MLTVVYVGVVDLGSIFYRLLERGRGWVIIFSRGDCCSYRHMVYLEAITRQSTYSTSRVTIYQYASLYGLLYLEATETWSESREFFFSPNVYALPFASSVTQEISSTF